MQGKYHSAKFSSVNGGERPTIVSNNLQVSLIWAISLRLSIILLRIYNIIYYNS